MKRRPSPLVCAARILLAACAFGLAAVAFTGWLDLLSAPSTASVYLAYLAAAMVCAVCAAALTKYKRRLQAMGKTLGKLWLAVCALSVLSTLGGCGYTRIDPGYAGIKVSLTGSNRGKELPPIVTGRVFYNPWSYSVYEFPTFDQQYAFTADKTEGNDNDEHITFSSKEGAQVDGNVAVVYRYEWDKVPSIFVEFRRNPDEMRHQFVRTWLRDAFQRAGVKYTALEILTTKKADLLDDVKRELNALYGPKGIPFANVSFTDKPRVPQDFAAAINNALAATQNAIAAENEQKRVAAQSQQDVIRAEATARATVLTAKAQAEANDLLARSISPNLIAYERLQVQKRVVESARWDGRAVPQTAVGAGGAGLLLSLDK